MIETLTVDKLHEKSDLALETERIHEQNPELAENVEAVLQLTAELERNDLPQDRFDYFSDERREIVDQLLDIPYEAFVTEVDILTSRYKNRTLQSVDMSGARHRDYVTRDPERQKADLHFRIIDFKSGKSKVQVEVPMRGDLLDENAQPFFVTADGDGEITVEQRKYVRGGYEYKNIPVETEQGKEYLWRFFTYSITATDLMDNRTEVEQTIADTQAKQMLADKILRQ